MERKGYLTKLFTSTINYYSWTNLSMAKMIAFPPGCYGSWVHWVLNHLSNVDTGVTTPPLSEQGDAHNWNNQNCFGHLTKKFMSNPLSVNEDSLCRCHLDKDPVNNDITKTMDWILDNFSKTIYLYAEENSICWMANVKLDKIWQGAGKPTIDQYFHKDYQHSGNTDWEFIFANHDEILNNWPAEYDENDILNKWIIREYLSLVLYNSLYRNFCLDKLKHFKSLDLLPVNVVDLRDNFSATILKMVDYLDLKINHSVDLDELYRVWKDSQKHFFKDQLIHNIVDATIGNKDLDWAGLSIVDEAMIQHYLREQGYEIKCYGLNDFPTNSKQLRELIYATQ